MTSVLMNSKGKIETVVLDWDNIAVDEIPAGTPIGADGRIHNDGQARGLLMRTENEPWSGTADIIVAGYVDLAEAEEKSGVTLSNEAMNAMHNVIFSGNNGKVVGMVAVAG